MDSISILSDPVRCRYPLGPPDGIIELLVQFCEFRFSVFRRDFLLFSRSASQPDEQIMVHAPALKRVGPENMVSSHNDPVFSPTSSTSESGQFSILSSRKKRPTPLTDASLELPHQVPMSSSSPANGKSTLRSKRLSSFSSSSSSTSPPSCVAANASRSRLSLRTVSSCVPIVCFGTKQ